MERQNFGNAIKEVYEYFRLSTFPIEETIDRWHEKVKFIPDTKLDEIINAIEDLDSLPRNIPNLFIAKYKSLPGKKRKYDPIEDYSYPMEYLWQGLKALKNQGEDAFHKFCDEKGMPQNDRARVLAKYKKAYLYQDIKELENGLPF